MTFGRLVGDEAGIAARYLAAMPDAAAKRPNLLYIMCDELRWSEVGCYGHERARTPHMDAFAVEGTRVEHAVSNSPVCMAARSIVLSGQHARTCAGSAGNPCLKWRRDGDGEHGWLFDNYAPPQKVGFNDPTLPQLLQRAGYHTRAVGKWHVDAWPHDLGFDDYLIPRNHHAHTAQPFTENGGPEFCPSGFSVDYEADRVCDFFNTDVAGDEPWFLYYNISPPHMPLADMPEKYLSMFNPADAILRPNVLEGWEPTEAMRLTYLWDYRHYFNKMPHATKLPHEGFGLRELTALYWGATAWVDDVLGRVLQSLDDAGHADDTLVVFTSDHGDILGSHGRMGKSTLHEESYRIPFLARGPGVAGGRVLDDGVASLVDIAPTFLAAAGADIPGHLHGVNLLPALAGDAALPSHAIIETAPDGTGVRTPTHVYGLERDGQTLTDNAHRFHDLTDDPHQLGRCEDDAVAANLDNIVREWDARTPWHAMPEK